MLNDHQTNQNQSHNQEQDQEHNKVVKLPWIPGMSPKLRKSFRAAGYRTVFKSGANLKALLTSKNKSRLPPNSQPGVYMINRNCGKKYVGETGLKISTQTSQHKKYIETWT